MNSQWTLYVMLSGVAFAVALLSVLKQWLRSDDDAIAVEIGLRKNRREEQARSQAMAMSAMTETAGGTYEVPSQTTTAASAEPELLDQSKPRLIADDEHAVARLCFGWGGGGMLVGMLSGAATHGFIGALLGSVILSTASIGVAVVIALVLDRRTLKAWNAKKAAEAKGE